MRNLFCNSLYNLINLKRKCTKLSGIFYRGITEASCNFESLVFTFATMSSNVEEVSGMT